MARANQNRLDTKKKLAAKTTWEKISVPVTVISIVITLALGFLNFNLNRDKNLLDQQKELWQGRLDHSKDLLEEKQKQLDLAKLELEKVKQDLSEYVKKDPSGGLSKETKISDNTFTIRLMRSQAINLQPNLRMEITDLVFKSSPDRYTVNATVNYKDHPEMTIANAEVGYKVTYPKTDGYDIEVLVVTPVSATFGITKSPNHPSK
jgi:hypothetical protein